MEITNGLEVGFSRGDERDMYDCSLVVLIDYELGYIKAYLFYEMDGLNNK